MNAENNSRSGSDEHLRRRRTSRHLLLSVMAVAIFGSAILALSWSDGKQDRPVPSGSPSPTPTVAAVQPTVLIQANGDSGAEINLLTSLSTDEDPDAILVSMSPDLMVSAPGADSESIRATVSSIDTLRAPSAVSATLGVRVDGSWRLDRKALAGLIDAAGGVTVTVAKSLKIRDGSGKVVLTLKVGENLLTGAEASWYAVGEVKGQAPEAKMRRGVTVFQQSIAALPDDVTNVRETLTSLGALAPTTIGAQTLAEYLVEFGRALRDGDETSFALPTTQIAIGQVDYEWTNFDKATPMLREALPLAQWNATGGMPPRVLVVSGSVIPGWIGSTRVRIERLGYVFVDGRGTNVAKARSSTVSSRGIQPWGGEVARVLGLPETAVKVFPETGTPPLGRPWADVDVALQKDYRP